MLMRTIGLIVLILTLTACTTSVSHRAAFPSPDGSIVADWFVVSGGTDVRWAVSEVRLRKSSELPIFEEHQVVFKGASDRKPTISWKSNTALEIAHADGPLVGRAWPQWNSVSISYRYESAPIKP